MENGKLQQKRKDRFMREIFLMLQTKIHNHMQNLFKSPETHRKIDQLFIEGKSPEELVDSLFSRLIQKGELP